MTPDDKLLAPLLAAPKLPLTLHLIKDDGTEVSYAGYKPQVIRFEQEDGMLKNTDRIEFPPSREYAATVTIARLAYKGTSVLDFTLGAVLYLQSFSSDVAIYPAFDKGSLTIELDEDEKEGEDLDPERMKTAIEWAIEQLECEGCYPENCTGVRELYAAIGKEVPE